jgi:HNH endonuclease
MYAPPTADAQLTFLRQLQRVLNEGSVTATYKYALILALADLAVLHGDDSGAPLVLARRDIAAAMIRLYWRQAAPFPGVRGRSPEVLRQSTLRQAEIITIIQRVRDAHGSSLPRLQQQPMAWQRLVSQVSDRVRKHPLWRLQRVGDQILPFLYPHESDATIVTLFPGAAYCLRVFHPMIVDLVQGAWIRYVRAHNLEMFAEATDISTFLFGSERSSLKECRALLAVVDESRCFYCQRLVSEMAAVDHFIPWARYPVDLGHNLVLAHRDCNGAKSDTLAAEEHLSHWLERNHRYGSALSQGFEVAGFPHDMEASESIARWAYGQTALANGQVWVKGRVLRPLSTAWGQLFEQAL